MKCPYCKITTTVNDYPHTSNNYPRTIKVTEELAECTANCMAYNHGTCLMMKPYDITIRK